MGARRIKLVGMAGGSGPAELQWAVDVPTPAGIFGVDGHFDAVAAGRVLGQLIADAPAHGALAGAVVLPVTSLRVRRLQTAVSDALALKRILVEDSELRVPGVPVEGVHHVVYALGDTPMGGRGDAGRAVLASAARRDVIRAYMVAGGVGGIEPLRIAAPAVALANLHRELHPDDVEQPVLLVHVGSLRSELVVVHRGAPLLSLALVQGTDHLFDSIRAAGGAGSEDPEALLRASAVVVPALEEWVARVRGSHRTALGAAERLLRCDLRILPVRVSGGIARYSAVMGRLAESIPAEVGVLDPGVRLSAAAGADVFGPALVLAAGAAIEARDALVGSGLDGEGVSTSVQLDLAVVEGSGTSRSLRPILVALVRDPGLWLAVLLAAVLAFAVPVGLEWRVERGERDLANARAAYGREAAEVAADSARVGALQADSARLTGTLGRLAVLEARRYGWPKVMHAAAEALPPFAWLESLEMDAAGPAEVTRIRLSGVAPAQADISRYERQLVAAGDIRSTRLEGSVSLAAGPFALVGFRLSGTVGVAGSAVDHPQGEGAGYNAGPPATSAPHIAP